MILINNRGNCQGVLVRNKRKSERSRENVSNLPVDVVHA